MREDDVELEEGRERKASEAEKREKANGNRNGKGG